MTVPYETAERIRLKKAQYCRFIDTKQWQAFAQLALPDATFTFFGVDGKVLHQFASVQDLLVPTAGMLAEARTSHRVCNSELRAISETEVGAIWAMEDYLVFPTNDGRASRAMHGLGHYHEVWKKHQGDWFLKKLELRRQILNWFALQRGHPRVPAEASP